MYNLSVKYNVKLIKRQDSPSLPLSINEGITNTQKEYVMWLDADGSMDIESINKLISECNNIVYMDHGSFLEEDIREKM